MPKARRVFTLDRTEATHELRELFPPGSTAYTVLRHVSGSGMSRAIDVYALGRNGSGECSPRWLSPKVGVVIDEDWSEHYEALNIGGCGMDMGFHVVYSLSAALYGHAQDRRSKRMQPAVPLTPAEARKLAAWRRAERKRSPHHANTSGGYAISQRWL